MKIVIPFINEMWDYAGEHYQDYVRYDVITKKSLLGFATPEKEESVEIMIGNIMYGEVIAYSFNNYNIFKGQEFPDVVFIFKLKHGNKFDEKVFLINPELKIKNIGRWVIIEKDWTNAIEDYKNQLEINQELKKLSQELSLVEEAIEEKF